MLSFLALLASATAAPAPVPAAPFAVVSPAWVRANTPDPDLVVLYVTAPGTSSADPYSAGHIPGARVLDFHSIFTGDGKGALTMELVSTDSLRKIFESVGVSDHNHILLYGSAPWMSAVARVFVTLDYLGFGNRTHILDGGYAAWKASGGPIETAAPQVTRGTLHLAPRTDAVVDGSYVRAHLADRNVTIVDARAPEFYAGQRTGHYATRNGHVTGARNVYFMTLADSAANTYLTPQQARARFVAAGVPLDKPVIVYCHIGQTASVDYVQLRRLGVPVQLYDGSFEDWSKHADYPIASGDKP